jgi:hypothetical protein
VLFTTAERRVEAASSSNKVNVDVGGPPASEFWVQPNFATAAWGTSAGVHALEE